MLSHFITGDSKALLHIASVGIFLNVPWVDSLTCFLNKYSASSKIPTRSVEGLTSPPLARAEIELVD